MIDAASADRQREAAHALRPPPLVDLSLEVPRTWGALARFAAVAPLLTTAPRGDGHPVLVLPGFLASDVSTWPLRTFVGRLGYPAYGWRLGRNVGPTSAIVDGLTRAVDELQRSHARSPSIVGWSLGGVFGRELARMFPAMVRQVVTLGSPFNMVHLGQSRAGSSYLRRGHRQDESRRFGELRASPDPLPVPSTAVYTRTDGIVAWRTTVQRTDERSENVEVRGSHCGLGVNPAAVLAIADRLAQPEGTWSPFRPPLAFRRWYPRPWTGDDAADARERSWTA